MAYVKGLLTAMDSSPSPIPCNLSVLSAGSTAKKVAEGDAAMFGVIHKHFVTVGRFGSDPNSHKLVSYGKLEDKNPSSYLTQARWCQLENSLVVLVLTSYKGFQVLDYTGTKPLYSNKFETPPGAFSHRFAKGVASVGNHLFVGVGGGTLEFASLPPGTSEGTVLVLSVSEQSCKVDLTGQLKGHAAPISDVVANTKANQLVTADNEGTIILWQDPAATAEPTFTISDSSGVPCLCLGFWNTFIVSGFANGQLKLYDSESGVKVVEVTAHARPVIGLDVALNAGLLLSTSEDCTVCVWSLPVLKNPKLNLLHVELVENAVLCGARFMDNGGSRFAVSAYDSHEIKTFIRKSTPV